MVGETDIFIMVTQVGEKGVKSNQLLNLSSVERFAEEIEGEVKTVVWFKIKTPATKTDGGEFFMELSTPIEKIMERLRDVSKLK